jgi:hypothetical protein
MADVNTPPPGGFKEGGWYWDPGINESRQYSGGSFGGGTTINNPNQAGYGTRVSEEVQKQSGYVSKDQLQSSLNGLQNTTFQNYTSPDAPKVQTPAEIAAELKGSGLLPTGEAPKTPNLVQTYLDLTKQAGVDAIQGDIIKLKSQQDTIASQLQINKTAERGKIVAQNVIEGRISQETQQAQDQYDFVGRQLARKTDELNSALGNIKTIMDLTQTDYSNASKAYADQFSQAISLINLVHGIQQDQKNDAQKAQDNARANAQIYVNALKDGSIDLGSLAPDQQAQLNKLEVQAGFPIGFFQSIKKDPKADIISTTSDNGQIQVLIRNPDGTMSLQKYGTKTSSSGDQKTIDSQTTYSNAVSDAKRGATLKELVNHYKIPGGLSVEDVYSLYNSNSPYKKANESLDDVKQGIFGSN